MGLVNSKQAFVCNLQELLQARGVGIEEQLLEYFSDYIDSFPYIKPSLHPWDETYLIMMDDHYDEFLHSVSENFIEDFCIDIHKGNWSEVFFLCWVLVWFIYESNYGLI